MNDIIANGTIIDEMFVVLQRFSEKPALSNPIQRPFYSNLDDNVPSFLRNLQKWRLRDELTKSIEQEEKLKAELKHANDQINMIVEHNKLELDALNKINLEAKAQEKIQEEIIQRCMKRVEDLESILETKEQKLNDFEEREYETTCQLTMKHSLELAEKDQKILELEKYIRNNENQDVVALTRELERLRSQATKDEPSTDDSTIKISMAQHRLELEAQAKMIKTLEAELSKRQEINAEQIERLIEERNSEIKNLIREQSKEIHEKNVKIAKFEIKDYANIFRQISKNIFTNKEAPGPSGRPKKRRMVDDPEDLFHNYEDLDDAKFLELAKIIETTKKDVTTLINTEGPSEDVSGNFMEAKKIHGALAQLKEKDQTVSDLKQKTNQNNKRVDQEDPIEEYEYDYNDESDGESVKSETSSWDQIDDIF